MWIFMPDAFRTDSEKKILEEKKTGCLLKTSFVLVNSWLMLKACSLFSNF